MKTLLHWTMLVLTLFTSLSGFSQNNCTLVGWASQNGGVTGGGSATPTIVNNYAAFKSAVENETVKVVHISGTITFPSSGRINFQDQIGKTIYGLPGSKLLSSDLTAAGSGILYMKRCSNILIRNVKFEGPGAYDTDGNDNMTIDNCTNVWVDHCDFQDAVDGNLDIKNQTDYVSVTWCRFIYLKPPIPGGSGGADDHRFSNLFGSSDGATGDRGKLRITMANCWWAQGCKERMPRVRFGKVHLVNNYFSCAGNNHCVRAGFEADLRVESNYFDGVNQPIDLFNNDFTAVSSLNNTFVGTTGNTTGSGTAFSPPYSLTITPSANVKALVTAGAGTTLTSPNCSGGGGTTTYTLTATASPAGGGSVSGAGSYVAGSTATLTATPSAGYSFTGWSGDASGTTNPLSVTMGSGKTITANFTATTVNYTLTTTSSPLAGGTISRGPNATSYASGTVVSLTATAAAGYTFTGWSGDAAGTTNPLPVTISANKTVTANFTVASSTTYILSTTSSPAAGGSITRNPNATSYTSGTVVALTATPAAGYTFTGWTGDGSGTTNPLSVTMGAIKSVTASFQQTTTNAQIIYVSPTGSASNSGIDIAAPTTFQNALATLPAGGTIYMRGGTYSFSATIIIAEANSGTSGNTKKVFAYNGEVPVIDFSGQALTTSNRGIILDGDYWYFKGIIVQNAGDNGVLLSGNNNTFENCIFRKNRDSGLQLSRYNTTYNSISQWPSNNLILNCEAFDNKDATAENADGFAAKLTCGTGNIFRGCIAHNNSDDGWDFYAKTETGAIGVVTLDNCIAYNNGTLTDGTTSSNGDKNGFKLGGSGISVNHVVRRCIAFGNGHHGFTDNDNPGNIELSNNTSWNNVESNFNFRAGSNSTHRNNLSFNAGSSDKTEGTDVGNSNVWWKNNVSTNTGSLVVSSADFVSLSFPSSYKNADGSPNLGNFLALAAGSDMIDAGVNAAGITFNGNATDIGARESGGSVIVSYTLITAATPAAGGSVTRSPNATSYTSGTVVSLTATPAAGYTFTGWSGDASGATNPLSITVNTNKTVTANFTLTTTTTYTLTTTASPTAGGIVSRSPNSTPYALGTVVSLTAAAAAGYTFTGWSGDASGTTNPLSVTMSANKTVTANFTTSTATSYILTTASSPAAAGTISRGPNATSYASGTVVSLTATPAAGYTFSSWSGDGSGIANPLSVTMSANKSVTAIFTAVATGNTTLHIEDKSSTTSGYCGADGSRQNSYSGANGGYYINLSNTSGSGIDWSVKAGATGTYTLKWRYSNAGSQSATSARLLVNGSQAIASVAFAKTTSWSTWTTTASVTVTLVAGTNKIRLETTSGNEFAVIDWIEITGNNPAEASCSALAGARIISNVNAEMPYDDVDMKPVLFPNPVTENKTTLRFFSDKTQQIKINIFAANGKLLTNAASRLFVRGTHYVAIAKSSLKAGFYYVTIYYENGKKTTMPMIIQ